MSRNRAPCDQNEFPDLAAELREGLAAAERGETVDRGSFEQYLDDEASPDGCCPRKAEPR